MTSPRRRYAVLQAGARMHYAVPALLARKQALAAFYTDLHASHRPLQLLRACWPEKLRPKPMQRLFGRQLPKGLPRRSVRDQPLASLTWARDGARADALVLDRACRERFADADALYTNFINNDLEAVGQARRQGLHVVHELIIGADVGRLMLEERRMHPGIEVHLESEAEVEEGVSRDQHKWELSDRVLVPSQYTWESSVALGCDPAKLRLVPYGIDEFWLGLDSRPEQGRLLFVGQVGLRKGSHVLAAACRELHRRRAAFTCVVAGPPITTLEHPIYAGPTYLGQVPRTQVQQEFRRADLFVLPTLADSFGLVHLEAMACGVPVITTPHCGSVVRDGIEGFIVPIRDERTLADRIQQLLEDRPLRERMGRAARERARQYTWEHYGRRLAEALEVA